MAHRNFAHCYRQLLSFKFPRKQNDCHLLTSIIKASCLSALHTLMLTDVLMQAHARGLVANACCLLAHTRSGADSPATVDRP